MLHVKTENHFLYAIGKKNAKQHGIWTQLKLGIILDFLGLLFF